MSSASGDKVMQRNSPPLSGQTSKPLLSGLIVLGAIFALLGALNIFDILRAGHANWLQLTNSLLLPFGFAILLLTYRNMQSHLFAPLVELRHWVRQMSNGHLSARLPATAEPAFKALYNDINSLGSRLENLSLDLQSEDEETYQMTIMEERTRMANELHDSLAQSLASLKFQVRVLDETLLHSGEESALWNELELIENSLDEAYTELRELITHFRAPVDKRGLLPAVEQAVERFRRNSKISAFLQVEWNSVSLPSKIEIQVVRIIQEALANIRKHSEANAVRVLMRATSDETFMVMIEDDGIGIGIQNTMLQGNPGDHIGLKILEERAAHIGGELTIETEPGDGTRVILSFSYLNH